MVSVPTSAVGERAKWVLGRLTDRLSVPECSHFDSVAAKLAQNEQLPSALDAVRAHSWCVGALFLKERVTRNNIHIP